MSTDSIPIWALLALTVVIVMIAVEAGCFIGRNALRKSHMEKVAPVSSIVGSTLGLLAFMLAFTFGTVASRYDARKALVRDEANPRSVAFQVKGLSEYVSKLESSHGRFASTVLAPAQAALRRLAPADLDPESESLRHVLDQLQRAALTVSDELNLKFFSHAASRSVLSLVA